ncbi:MAG: phosphatidate cytidylyltransferase [Thermoleophilaceae bacterium]|nr:phosphatidate cytidylyltransferase [Thermoleophilaceae bacterium]
MSDTGARILVAIPAIVFAAVIVSQGGPVFAVGAVLLGIVAMGELYGMMSRVRPAALAGFLALVGMAAAALYGDQHQILLVLAASVPVTFVLSLLRPQRAHISWAMAATFLGIVWIGLAFAHAILLRESGHGGALLLDVLIGTFLTDTCAYFVGRAWGSRPIAPQISPNKTLEGLIGGIVGGTFFFWLFAIAYQHDWFKGPDALLIGFCVALATPLGDLFESAIKRDLDVKDAGRLFGAHGGVLDRLDGLFFSVVVGFYVSQAVLG